MTPLYHSYHNSAIHLELPLILPLLLQYLPSSKGLSYNHHNRCLYFVISLIFTLTLGGKNIIIPFYRWTNWCLGSLRILLKAAAAAKSCQSYLTLCNPMDGNPPGSAVPGIFQARTLEWVAISFSNAWKWKVKLLSVSDSFRPHRLQPTRLLRPWDFPGKSTGLGCHCLQKQGLYFNTISLFACDDSFQ